MEPLSLRDRLVAEGWFLNVTRWTDGWQVSAYWPAHPARYGAHSCWCRTEAEAWQDLAPAVERLHRALAIRGPGGATESPSLDY
ncbi:MAG: hypothetical protein RL199_285 [Pseudomonadota bacterium]|jgi:hypothetical protein